MFRIPEFWDPERKFSAENVEYTLNEVVEIILKIKDHYGTITFLYPTDQDFILKLCYHFNDDCLTPIREYLSSDFERISKIPSIIVELYFEIPKSKYKHLKYATWFLIVNDYRDRQFSTIVLADYFGIDNFSELITKFNDLPHNPTTEKIIKYCIDNNWFTEYYIIKILISYVNKFKKIPDLLMDYIKDKCNTSELYEKHFTDDLLVYYNKHSELSFGLIINDYILNYDKRIIKKNIKSMLLAFKTLHEDLPNDDKKHYKVSKELIDAILYHPGFSKYANSKYSVN